MKEVWVERYRPETLDDVLGQPDIVERLQAYVKSGNLPHLMFAGPAGVGKTTCALILAKGMLGDDWRDNFIEVNASSAGGIDLFRSRREQSKPDRYPSIKDYVRSQPLGDAPFRMVFLDEADNLTRDAQQAFRRTMEQYSSNSRFVLSCNYSSRIIDPIQSRCAVFRFRPVRREAVERAVARIAEAEDLDVTDDGLDALVYIAQGDLRRAVNTLQMSAAVSPRIDEEVLYKVTSTARPEEVQAMVEAALEGDFPAARDKLDGLLITYGMSGEDVVRQLHRVLFDMSIPDPLRLDLVDAVGEVDFRLVEGANERIQLEALLARFTAAGGH